LKLRCPSCGAREVGRLAAAHHYCWRCFVEFTVGETGVEVFEIAEDGSLVPLEPGDSRPVGVGTGGWRKAALPGR